MAGAQGVTDAITVVGEGILAVGKDENGAGDVTDAVSAIPTRGLEPNGCLVLAEIEADGVKVAKSKKGARYEPVAQK